MAEALTIERFFSDEQIHPYDELEWGTRDALLTNFQTGAVTFEQNGLHFPTSWVDDSVKITAPKYFYGDVAKGNGSPATGQREYDLRQLIDRVVGTIVEEGLRSGMLTAETAEVFRRELTWLCVNQYGAFNSPVWFNVGLGQAYGLRETDPKAMTFGIDRDENSPTFGEVTLVDPYLRPQGSACFITKIGDSVEEIWQVMADSARLFKYGSGVGGDWSALRSTLDRISGGGTPSGPVSFMEVQDTTGGTIKSGGKTRRAAIMQTLRDWHPDVLEFVAAKQNEERKAWALIEGGYDGSFNGPAYGSVAFQNVNQSVRLSDAVMRKAGLPDAADRTYDLTSPATGAVLGTLDAGDLLDAIADGTYVCGDPGVQYEDIIQAWHTCPNSGPINSSNPCSEYMFLDDSACNLASLNLRKFQRPDGTFDTVRLGRAARVFAVAQEIIVGLASYPTPAIARNSEDYRPLGLGFANLGAALMAMGVPYDSDEGRDIAAALMAIVHFSGYHASADGAAAVGPFAGFEANREPMLAVIDKHVAEARKLRDTFKRDYAPSDAKRLGLTELAAAVWDSAKACQEAGRTHGYRNAQATVLAPTGTIGFMMACDTTGIEPDLALVKYKLLAGKGDGMMKIVNGTVPEALNHLGYADQPWPSDYKGGNASGTLRDAIVDYIAEHDTIEGAPGLEDEHLPVFDCAFKPHNGERALGYRAHLKMMAACQPFISGAISKTVNLPESATPADIRKAYVEGWEMNLKAIAVYRENSKRSQPLNVSSGGSSEPKVLEIEQLTPEAQAQSDRIMVELVQEAVKTGRLELSDVAAKLGITPAPLRKRLPDERPSITHKFRIGTHEGYLTIGLYPDTGLPGEVFVTMSKQGSSLSGMMDAWAVAMSLALQHGVPLDQFVRKYARMQFEPSGFTGSDKIGRATSPVDYIVRYCEQRLAQAGGVQAIAEVNSLVGGFDPAEAATTWAEAPSNDVLSALTTGSVAAEPSIEMVISHADEASPDDGEPCGECGGPTKPAGACRVCINCGSNTGCG